MKNARRIDNFKYYDNCYDCDEGDKMTKEELEKENAELKEKVSFLEDNLRVARKDREDLQLDVAKGLKEFVKDYPATAFRYLANEKYVEHLTKAKELLERFLGLGNLWDLDCKDYFPLRKEVEQFLNGEV